MFNVLNLETGCLVLDNDGKMLEWENGVAAQNYCRLVPFKCQPRKKVENTNWEEREYRKFKTGEYFLPEFLKPYVFHHHFVHISKNFAGHLAYTKNAENGKLDIQSKITLSGYIEKYLINHINSETLNMIEHQFALYLTDNDGLKFATDPDDIVRVYRNYVPYESLDESCMKYSFKHFPKHPVSVYGAGDLAIAYITQEEKTSARALVWPEKKLYSRVYGLEILHDLLKNRGYQKGSYYGGDSMEGAKILKIPYRSTYIMPYFDEKNLKVESTKDGKYFELAYCEDADEEQIFLYSAVGVADPDFEEPFRCERCDEECGDPAYVGTSTYTSRRWCSSCVDGYSFRCARSERLFSADNYEPITMYNGDIWCDAQFRQYGFSCDLNGKNYPNTTRRIVNGLNGDVHYWPSIEFNKRGWTCTISRLHYTNDVPFTFYTDEFSIQNKVHPQSSISDKRMIFSYNGEYFHICHLLGNSYDQ